MTKATSLKIEVVADLAAAGSNADPRPELEEQKLLILRKEIQLHVDGNMMFHVANQLKLQRCLRSQLKSSAEAAIILDQCRRTI